MTACLAHPNDLDAREHRVACVKHAARTLYRDPKWIGSIETGDWLRGIHYMDSPKQKRVILGWLEVAGINPWRPVNELRGDQRARLIEQMHAYVKGSGR